MSPLAGTVGFPEMVLGVQFNGTWGPATNPGPHDSTEVTKPYIRQHFRHFGVFPDIILLCLPDYDVGWVVLVAQLTKEKTEAEMNYVICWRSSSSAAFRKFKSCWGLGLWPPDSEYSSKVEEERNHLRAQTLRQLNPDSSGQLILSGQSASRDPLGWPCKDSLC